MNPLLRLLPVLPLLLLVGISAAAVPPAGADEPSRVTAGPVPMPVPLPDLARLEPIVQDQLGKARGELETALADPTLEPRILGERFGEMGRLYHAHHLGDPARACYHNAHALDPQRFDWPYLLAYLLQAAGDLDAAADGYRAALRLRPDYAPAKLRLAQVEIDRNRPERAEPLLRQVMDTPGLEAAARFGLGRAALLRRDYPEAASRFERALALEPEAVRIHYPLAMAYRGLRDIAKARHHIALHGGREPSIPDPVVDALGPLMTGARTQLYRAIKAAQNKQYPVAAQAFRRSLQLDPSNVAARVRLARVLHLLEDDPGTLGQLREALRHEPSNKEALFYMGRWYEEHGDDAEAMRRFRAALAVDPSYADAHYQLGNALMRSGDYEAAAAQYARVVALQPQRLPARLLEALALIAEGRHTAARERLEAALGINPDDPMLQHVLARLLAAAPDPRVRDGRRALAMASRLLERTRDPSDGETMAMAFAEIGDFEQAVSGQRGLVEFARQRGRDDLLPWLQSNLDRYRNHQACRRPWPEDNALFSPRRGDPTNTEKLSPSGKRASFVP
jgi:tetratricopeptide (TPR) repeat protein